MKNPYVKLPKTSYWRRTVSVAPEEVDPVAKFDLKILPDTKIATAGSCFAQHIARHLQQSGYHYYVSEPGHSFLPEAVRRDNNYGLFSARYGNIYTTRQLVQLMDRAFGRFQPEEAAWVEADGSVLDPFRPTTQPGGYWSEAEMQIDRTQHLAAVRELFENCDVFVFTLGLTETWRAKADGAVFPICPGVSGGVFDEEKYEFYNQSAQDVIEDLTYFRTRLLEVNPKVEIILTVSPVPLMATARTDSSVIESTCYSKSVLRVAAETLRCAHENVHYFPSYEIITGGFNRGAYYAEDLRNVTEIGVEHAMRMFFRHAVRGDPAELAAQAAKPSDEGAVSLDRHALAQNLVQVECDEVALDPGQASS